MVSVTLGLKAPRLSILAARMQGLSETGITSAVSSTLTFLAKDYTVEKLKTISKDIDRPSPFTRRAYSWDGANPGDNPIQSRAYVRPKQAEYLDWTEFGGQRTGVVGTPDTPVWIKDGYTDKFGGGFGAGGFRKRWLDRSIKRSATAKRGKRNSYAPGTKLYRIFTLEKDGHKLTGIWELTKLSKKKQGVGRRTGPHFGPNLKRSWKTFLIVEFLSVGDYDEPHLNFAKDALRFGRRNMGPTMQRVLDRQIAKLRS